MDHQSRRDMLTSDFIQWLSGFLDATEGGLTPKQTARLVSKLQSTMVKVTPGVPKEQPPVSTSVMLDQLDYEEEQEKTRAHVLSVDLVKEHEEMINDLRLDRNNEKLLALVRSMTAAEWIAAGAYMTRTPFGVGRDIAAILQSESDPI